jgi:two-component system phosphate regulon sensor histidine kinase PhoR
MAATGEPPVPEPAKWQDSLARLAAARWIFAAAAALLLLLGAFDRLGWIEALLLFAAIAAAAMLRTPASRMRETDRPSPTASLGSPIEPQLAALVAALPDPALLVDRRATVIAGNEAGAASFGPMRHGEPLSLTLRAPEVIEAVRAVLGDGEPRCVEHTERVPVERSFEAHIVPVVLASGSDRAVSAPDAVLLTFRDLTQQHRVDRMRADFVANASHELRTPLASLSGFIETLQGPAREDPAARDRFLSIMVEQARRMSRLIDDLLSLSRVELNEHLRPQTAIDLVPIVGQVCETLLPLANERGVELIVKRDATHLPILGERDELIRLVENLVENALKYGAGGKRVEVILAQEGTGGSAEAVVTVRDFGRGIASEHLPRLTERFYRVDVETSRAEGGTGLGLAIVKHILSRHRGRLAVDSKVGKGAAFSARIPLSTGGNEISQSKSDN